MGTLYCVSGMSGVGKTSIMRYAMGNKREIVSVTTRPIRDGEVDGVDYYFITQEQFDELDANGLLAEKTTYYGSASYGVTKGEIENKLSKGNAYIIVDFNGYSQLQETYPDLVGIFLYTSKETAMDRMKLRGDTLEAIEKRISTFETEMANNVHYDFVIQNTNFYNTAEIIKRIVE